MTTTTTATTIKKRMKRVSNASNNNTSATTTTAKRNKGGTNINDEVNDNDNDNDNDEDMKDYNNHCINNNNCNTITSSSTSNSSNYVTTTTSLCSNPNGDDVIIRFRNNNNSAPNASSSNNQIITTTTKVFPPILFTNVQYMNGIRLVMLNRMMNNENGCTMIECIVPRDYYYIPNSNNHNDPNSSTNSKSTVALHVQQHLQQQQQQQQQQQPQLTPIQSYLWSQPYMAQYIVIDSIVTSKRCTTTTKNTTTTTTNTTTSTSIDKQQQQLQLQQQRDLPKLIKTKKNDNNTTTTINNNSSYLIMKNHSNNSSTMDPKYAYRFLGTITRTLPCYNNNSNDNNNNNDIDTTIDATKKPSTTTTTGSVSDDSSLLLFMLFDEYVKKKNKVKKVIKRTPNHHQCNQIPTMSLPLTNHNNHNNNHTTNCCVITKSIAQSIIQHDQRRLYKRNIGSNTTTTTSSLSVNSTITTKSSNICPNTNENNNNNYMISTIQSIWNQNIYHHHPNKLSSKKKMMHTTAIKWYDEIYGDIIPKRIGHDPQFISICDLLHILQQQQVMMKRNNNDDIDDYDGNGKNDLKPNCASNNNRKRRRHVKNPKQNKQQEEHDTISAEQEQYNQQQEHGRKFLKERQQQQDVVQELLDILHACHDLTNPKELWNIPLIVVYPIVTITGDNTISNSRNQQSTNNKSIISIQLGIYVHRLLMEVYTASSLSILLQALDVNSYHTTINKCEISSTISSSSAAAAAVAAVATTMKATTAKSSLTSNETRMNVTASCQNNSDDPIFVAGQYPKVLYTKQHRSKATTKSKESQKNKKADHINKKRKATIIDNDSDNDRKMPAKPRGISPSTTTTINLSENNISDNSNVDDDCVIEEPTVSAYTSTGLLKILEDESCCISNMIPNWYQFYTSYICPLLYNKLNISLMLHQQYGIVWMYHMEQLPNFGLNSLFWEEREFIDDIQFCQKEQGTDATSFGIIYDKIKSYSTISKYYVNTVLGQIRLEPPETMKGGMLCDEMGLGKTCAIIALVTATIDELKKERDVYNSALNNEINCAMVHSTLIIVPPTLVSQWENEIYICTGSNLIVEIVDSKGALSRRLNAICDASATVQPDTDADIVITTYRALAQKKVASAFYQKRWGRIVLDEMQEIRSSTSSIALSCEKLEGNRRWMLSGTPIFDGIDDLRGELNFLRLEPFSAASEDGFFDFMIKQPWIDHKYDAIKVLKVLGKVMLRRSKNVTIKSTGLTIMDLKPLTVEFVPIVQTMNERAIYYFMESILARVARSAKTIQLSTSTQSEIKRAKTSRKACLRLLRDTCNSIYLLNGGMGAPQQLSVLNNILIAEARNAAQLLATDTNDLNLPNVISCDEAIVHLAQVQHATRTGDGEVAFLSLGFGQGLSKRLRASDSIDEKLSELKDKYKKTKVECVELKSKRAKSNWLLALELLTTGRLRNEAGNKSISLKYRSLWAWRSILFHLRSNHKWSVSHSNALSRGWRPSLNLTKLWPKKHPEFFWSHPHSLMMRNIPKHVSVLDLASAISNTLVEAKIYESSVTANDNFHILELHNNEETLSWHAGVQFENKDDCVVTLHKASSPRGIVVPNTASRTEMVDVILHYRTLREIARSTCSLRPTEVNYTNLQISSKAVNLAELGVRILHISPQPEELKGVIFVTSACGQFRTINDQTTSTDLKKQIEWLKQSVDRSVELLKEQDRRINRLNQLLKNEYTATDESIMASSSIEKLNELVRGNQKDTHCCICLDYLGSNYDNNVTANISMIDCGHLYCRKCLESCRNICPTCRRPFQFGKNVNYIDLTLAADRDYVLKKKIEEKKKDLLDAYRMLDESDGILDPEVWERLYYAIDMECDSDIDIRVSAVPRRLLGHIRASVNGLPIMSSKALIPPGLDRNSRCLPTKVQALVDDLPVGERSVVFSSSIATIMHLECVLNELNIGCRSIFVGQDMESSESALKEWHSTSRNDNLLLNNDKILFPVLLVQAGAAASGLTLTAASKMFIMEPFLRYSEEIQAYGRCHRHGQTSAVYVKCYYVPQSFESRLLDRRKRIKEVYTATTNQLYNDENNQLNNSSIQFSTLYGDESDQDDS